MKTSLKVLYWVPRITCILAILFISLFAADAFAPGFTIWQQLQDFFFHLIPSFVLLGFLVLAWKRELIGGIIFTVLGIVFTPFIFALNYNRNHSLTLSLAIILLITVPFIIVGILFTLSHYLERKEATKGVHTS